MKTSSTSAGRSGAGARSRAGHEEHHKAKHHKKHHEKHTKHHKRRRKRKHKHRKHVRHAAPKPRGTLAIPPPSPRPPLPRLPPPRSNRWALRSRLPRHSGCAGARASDRRPDRPRRLPDSRCSRSIYGLTRPSGAAKLSGPEPTDDEGNPLAPADAWGEDHCWWLDRMVRSDQQLVERMTFVWHDWFANSNEKVNSQQMMLDQNNLFRGMALGSFHDLFLAVTGNPAMLVFLDGIYNEEDDPNENYAREMMELFSLGADRGAYTEDDVREMARALTGWTAEWSESAACTTSDSNPPATTRA